MLNPLYHVINVANAAATVERDRVRVLAVIESAPGFDAANSVCRGVVQGAIVSMGEPAVLRAALGSTNSLADLRGRRIVGRAMCAAAAGGFVAVVTLLLTRGSELDLEVPDTQHRNTPLGNAASGGHLEVCELLIAAGARLESRNRYHATPLMEAAAGGHTDVLVALVAAGADVEAASRFGSTALMSAARGGKAASVEALVALGASPAARNKDAATALDLARAAVAAAPALARIEDALS
jgi:hypothetical protein